MTTPVVIMAGGRGLRLRQLTDHQPKPMVTVGAKPMLQTVIERYAQAGFKLIYLCVGYKANLIEGHFGNGSQWGVKIKYSHEPSPLGTGGPLRRLPKFEVPFIVCNADVLCDYSPGLMLEAHARSNAQMTMAVWRYEHQIRYGVVDIDDLGGVAQLQEKPVWQWAINAGIYVLEPGALDAAPTGVWDMTDLVGRLDPINTYPIEGDWHDVGTLDDLERAKAQWLGSAG